MIIILALLLLFFMKNKKDNFNSQNGCGWNGDQPCQASNPNDHTWSG